MRNVTFFAFVSLLVMSFPLAAQQGPATQTFCVSGVSTGVGWSWGIISNGGLQSRAVVPPVAAGSGCNTLAAAFAGSINANSQCTATVSATNPCCFTVCCKQGFDFWIGDAAGDPAGKRCKVTNTPGGCSFNPLVIQTDNADVSSACAVGTDASDSKQ
ncbi:MAG TPA: hypothetical protein VF173_05590 [Thermoanaerobaculia bacterium]|nr:hypothetical protein [Thermoanaerobaculia bacterium]